MQPLSRDVRDEIDEYEIAAASETTNGRLEKRLCARVRGSIETSLTA